MRALAIVLVLAPLGGAVLPGCGDDDTGGDAEADLPDAETDGGGEVDGEPDADVPDGAEADVDAEPDGPADVPVDTPVDVEPDGPMDVEPDADAPMDVEPDADAEPDGPADLSDAEDADAEAEVEVRPDVGFEAEVVGGDVVRPRVTVEQGATQPDPATALPIRFAVTFDEPIDPATLDASDFAITPALPVTRTLVPAGDGVHFELQLSGLAPVDEQYQVTLPDSRVEDLAGNPSEPSTSRDNRVRYDAGQPTVEVRQYVPLVAVTNSLPLSFQVVFQMAVDAGALDADDVSNGGTAGPVTWVLESASPGYIYFARATAVGGTGTVYPVIRAGASTATLTGAPNLESVFVGTPPVYSPLPILAVTDAQAEEGNTIYLRAQFQGTLTSGTATVFDWATVDGTAVAGVDYVTTGGTDVTIAAGMSSANLPVSATPEDDLPEPHKQMTVVIRNVRGGVYVHDDTGTGTIVNDDRGYFSFGGNRGSDPETRPTEIRLSSDDVQVFGESYDWDPALVRRDLATGSVVRHLSVDPEDPGGLAMNSTGYFFATNATGYGYTLNRFDQASDGFDSGFGIDGQIEVMDAEDELRSVDLAADELRLYVVGTRTDPAGDSRWRLEAREAATGSLVSTFGTAGVLLLDRAVGSDVETPITAHSDGTSLFVLGRIGDDYRVEKRSATTGALDAAFADAGVLYVTWVEEAVDLAVHGGRLYVLGRTAVGDSSAVRLRGSDGLPEWIGFSVMDVPGCIAVDDTGVYLGGGRVSEMHLERWALDGTPLWARTYGLELAPTALTGIAIQPGGRWVHSVGYHTRDGHRDWYYDRRWIPDGFYYLHSPGEPLE